MSGIKLTPGHIVHIHRTGEPIQEFKILSFNKFEDNEGKVHDQQTVFCRSYARVDVIDPTTGEKAHY